MIKQTINAHMRVLQDMGLSNKDALVYLTMLRLGPNVAGNIAQKSGLPRATVYDILGRLVEFGLVSQITKGRIVTFIPEDPDKLLYLLDQRERDIEFQRREMRTLLPELKKIRNPYSRIPEVKFYEGEDGIRVVMLDSLTATEIIDSYVDTDSVAKFIPELNAEYAQERKEHKIRKRLIVPDTPTTRTYGTETYGMDFIQDVWKDDLNDVRFLDTKYDLYLSFMIYDQKISYITMEDDEFVGVIIENQDIYNMHKSLFQFTWDHLKNTHLPTKKGKK